VLSEIEHREQPVERERDAWFEMFSTRIAASASCCSSVASGNRTRGTLVSRIVTVRSSRSIETRDSIQIAPKMGCSESGVVTEIAARDFKWF